MSSKPTLSLQPTGFTPVVFRSTSGPIRSLLEKCIDVPETNVASGVQLQMWDCNGAPAQKWWRPTATDLRLQTFYNLCMDASVNVGSGGAVVLSTCNANLQSQKWVYDGRNLRPKYNINLCLTIEGGSSFNGAKLVVWPCDNASNSAWVEYSISSVSGAAISGDTYSHFLCPVGSKVINISGRGGYWVDQLVMTCDDGRTVLGPAGGTGGGAVTSSNCTDGYKNVSVTSGTYVGQVKAVCSGSSTLTVSIGIAVYEGSGSTISLILQGGQRVIGMQVNSGTFVDGLALLYSSVSTNTSPTAFPSLKSSSKPSTFRSEQPTMAPVTSSIFTTLQIILKTDNKGSETWFYVHDLSNNSVTVLYSYSILDSNQTYPPFSAQVDKNHCYKVYMYDDGGDGMCCSYGQGYYEIWWSGMFILYYLNKLLKLVDDSDKSLNLLCF